MRARNKIIPLFIWVACTIVFVSSACTSEVRVEDLRTERGEICSIYGKIRNLENHSIKGYVRIKFLNANGDITKTGSAWVNDLDPIKPGQAAPFEYHTELEDCHGVVRFQVLFEER